MSQTQKSTNVRSSSVSLRVLRAASGALPGVVGPLANRLFFTPPRAKHFETAAAAWEQAKTFRVRARGRWLRAYKLGSGPAVLVQHGWGGRTTQLSPIIGALVDAGYAVLAVDAPGHGASGWSPASSIVHFADAIEAVVAAHGPVVGAVAHSLGAAAVALATQRSAPLQAAVLLAPFARPGAFHRGYLRHIGLPPAAVLATQARAERALGVRFDALNLPETLRAAKTVVIHDAADRMVPLASSEDLVAALPGATLVRTEGLGHNRILSDPSVLARIVAELHAVPGLRPAPRRGSLTEADLLADLHYGR